MKMRMVDLRIQMYLKNLRKTKQRGKDQIKWEGTIQDLKDFVELILKNTSTWTKKSSGKRSYHVFKEKGGEFTLSWWPSSKTISLQGNSENVAENKIGRLTEKSTAKPSETVDQTQGSPEEIMSKKPAKGSDVIQKIDLKKIWETIADLKTVVAKLSKNMNIKKTMETIEAQTTNSKKKCSQPKEKKKKQKMSVPKGDRLL